MLVKPMTDTEMFFLSVPHRQKYLFQENISIDNDKNPTSIINKKEKQNVINTVINVIYDPHLFQC